MKKILGIMHNIVINSFKLKTIGVHQIGIETLKKNIMT